MNKIYLDNQATTSLDPVVLDAMMPYLTKEQSHASILFQIGRFNTEAEIDSTIEKVVKTVNRIRKSSGVRRKYGNGN